MTVAVLDRNKILKIMWNLVPKGTKLLFRIKYKIIFLILSRFIFSPYFLNVKV